MATTVITIDGVDFTLEGIVTPFLDVRYHRDYDANAHTIPPLAESARDVAAALGVDADSFEAALEATIKSTCTGELAELAKLLRTTTACVTDLSIDTSSGVFVFGFCCKVADHGIKPYGVPLTAFGLEVRVLRRPSAKRGRPRVTQAKAKPRRPNKAGKARARKRRR